jgi:selenide,water dikinase
MNILEASNVAARLTLSSLPVLPGAEQFAASGIRSSLWPSNASLETKVSHPASPLSDLLYDPQTAGGLLAIVPAARAADVMTAFEDRREPAFLIGHIEAGTPHITVT